MPQIFKNTPLPPMRKYSRQNPDDPNSKVNRSGVRELKEKGQFVIITDHELAAWGYSGKRRGIFIASAYQWAKAKGGFKLRTGRTENNDATVMWHDGPRVDTTD